MNELLLMLNMLAALGITLRLLTYQHKEKSHNWRMALFSYGLIVACGVTVIRTITGQYAGPIDLSEVVLKFALFLVIWRVRGDLACLVYSGKRYE